MRANFLCLLMVQAFMVVINELRRSLPHDLFLVCSATREKRA